MDEREMNKRLRTVRDPAPPPALEARLMRGIPDSFRQPESSRRPGRWTMARIGAVTAAATVVGTIAAWITVGIVVGPGTPAFAEVLAPVARATDEVEAVYFVLRMLTREGEDFSYVNLGGAPRDVEAWIEWPKMPGSPGRAKIVKADRVYGFDGTDTVFYHPRRNEAYRVRGCRIDLDLFWPAAWVRSILGIPNEDVEVVTHDESGGRGRLVLRERGESDPRLEPSFLGEFDRETEIEWDLDSRRLTGLRRFVFHEGRRVPFSELVVVDYLTTIDDAVFTVALPTDVRWGGVAHGPEELAGLGPRESARRMLEAAREGDRATLAMLCPSPSMVDWLMAEENRPTAILRLGEPFRTGRYPGVYVPYEVRFGPHGPVKHHQLALRRDAGSGRWVYDGGI